MSEANEQLARRWFEEVWNKQNSSAIDEMFSAQGKSHGIPNPDSVLQGPEDFKILHSNFCGAFPDIHITVEDVITEGNKVAVRWLATMTHLGDHLGIPASGRKVTLAGSCFLTVEDGKILDGWNFMEMQAMLQSLKGGSPSESESYPRSASTTV